VAGWASLDVNTDLERFYALDEIRLQAADILGEKGQQSFYIPDHILDYAEPEYYEETEQTREMELFLKKCEVRPIGSSGSAAASAGRSAVAACGRDSGRSAEGRRRDDRNVDSGKSGDGRSLCDEARVHRIMVDMIDIIRDITVDDPLQATGEMLRLHCGGDGGHPE